MKSALILVSSFLVAAVHGSVLLGTRDNDNEGKGNDVQNPQGGNGTFSIHSNCTTPSQGTDQPSPGIPVTTPTNQSSDGAPPSQGLPLKCFNLTDPSGTQPSIVVQFNNTSAQGNQPPSNQTAPPDGNNNTSPGDPHFNFCPNPDGPAAPFANGTNVNYQEVPCPGQSNGTLTG